MWTVVGGAPVVTCSAGLEEDPVVQGQVQLRKAAVRPGSVRQQRRQC